MQFTNQTVLTKVLTIYAVRGATSYRVYTAADERPPPRTGTFADPRRWRPLSRKAHSQESEVRTTIDLNRLSSIMTDRLPMPHFGQTFCCR
jgi:hypothetical protein